MSAEAVVVLTVRLSMPGVKKKVGRGEVRVRAAGIADAEAHDPDEGSVAVSKTVLDAPEYAQLRAHDTAIRGYLRSQALPTRLAGGQYLVPLKLIERVDTHLQEMAAERERLVATFLEVYPRLIEEARARLGDLWDAADYPRTEVMRGQFDLASSISALAEPGSGLQQFSAALYQREVAKADKAREDMVREIRDGVRVAMAELMETLVDKLKPQQGLKPKIIASHVEKLQAFLTDFGATNVAKDASLEALVEKAKAIVAGVSPEKLRASTTAQAAVGNGLAAVKASLDGLITSDSAALRGGALELDDTPRVSAYLERMRASGQVAPLVTPVDLTKRRREAPAATVQSVRAPRAPVDLGESVTTPRTVDASTVARAAKLELE